MNTQKRHFGCSNILIKESNMPLFGKSSKSPSDVVRSLKDALITLEKGGQDAKKMEKVISIGLKK